VVRFVPSKATSKNKNQQPFHISKAGTVILNWKKELGDEGRNKNEKTWKRSTLQQKK